MARRILDHHYFMQDISVVACELLVSACGIQFPDQGSNTGLLFGSLSHWTTREVLPHSFFFFFFLSHFIIYFWLYQVMVAVQTFPQLQRTGATVMHRLPIVVASLVVEHRLQQLWHMGLVVGTPVEHGHNSCSTWAQLLCSMWDLPRPGIEPLSPTGGFLTTEPPGKPLPHYFLFYCLALYFNLSTYYYFMYYTLN